MKGSCSSVSKLLEKYFDREAKDNERIVAEGHLQDCPTCRDKLRLMEGLREAMKGPVEEATEKEDFQWVWQKVERGIRSKERLTWWESFRSWVDISPLFQRRVWIPAVVTLIIFIFISAPFLFKKNPSYLSSFTVKYVESRTHNVMVYELEKTKVTVIWLFEGKGSPTS